MANSDVIRAVGFIGLGIMGRSMALNLRQAGFELSIWARDPAKVADLVEEGMRLADSPAALAAEVDAAVTIVGFPRDVEEVYFGAGGLIENARPGTVLIDMTTSSPDLAKRIAAAAEARGLDALDAPVSGGDVGAKAGKLAIMVGGREPAFERARPLFAAMGQNINLLGPAGAGQHTKMVNQIVVAGTMIGVAEGVRYGEAAGLDMTSVIAAIETGGASSFQLSNQGRRMVDGDFAPGFYIQHFLKDLGIALGEADAAGLRLPILEQVRALFLAYAKSGGEMDGTQAILKHYRAMPLGEG